MNADEYAEEQLEFDQRLAMITDACLDAKAEGVTVEGDPDEFLAVLAVLRMARNQLPRIREIADSVVPTTRPGQEYVMREIVRLCDVIAGARAEVKR
jgi:hypothetical protein